MHLSPKWHIASGVRYQTLMGDAANSPVVAGRGSENPFTLNDYRWPNK